MSLEWVACSALTGEVVAEMPDLAVDEVVSLIGSYSTTTAVLPLVDDSTSHFEPSVEEVARNTFTNPDFVRATEETVPENPARPGTFAIGV